MFSLWTLLPDWPLGLKIAVVAAVILLYLACFAVAIYSKKGDGFLGFTLLIFFTLPGAFIIIDLVHFGFATLALYAIWIGAIVVVFFEAVYNLHAENKIKILAIWATISISVIVLGILVGLFTSGIWFVIAAAAIGLVYFASLVKFEEEFGILS